MHLIFHCLPTVHIFWIKTVGLCLLALALVRKIAILFPSHEKPSIGRQLGFIASQLSPLAWIMMDTRTMANRETEVQKCAQHKETSIHRSQMSFSCKYCSFLLVLINHPQNQCMYCFSKCHFPASVVQIS